MSKVISKAQLNKLLLGQPKRTVRNTIARIVALAQEISEKGIAFFPYYSKTLPDYEAYRATDSKRLLEREIGSFFYCTGNWEHLFEGHDVMAVWTDDSINASLQEAGFRVRSQNTAARNADDDADTSAVVTEVQVP